jgi:transketolase
MVLADRMDNGKSSGKQFYCLMSDGELDEGNSWEAAMLAGKEKLQNLTVIIDRNNIQIDGFTEDIMPLNPLADKWRSFNWHVQEINGHDFRDIDRAIGAAQAVFDRPSIIIANTIPSKGIPEFERKFEWHGRTPTTPVEIETARKALGEIRTLGGRIEAPHNS